jgi:hypothetical protein
MPRPRIISISSQEDRGINSWIDWLKQQKENFVPTGVLV